MKDVPICMLLILCNFRYDHENGHYKDLEKNDIIVLIFIYKQAYTLGLYG
jgi:hypothetical protein